MNKIIIFCLMLIGFASCNPTNSSNTVKAIDTYGQYKIITYVNNNVDYTSKFSGCLFQFGANGQVVMNKSGITSLGNWVFSPTTILIKNFTNDPYTVLNETWNINTLDNYTIDVTVTDGINTKHIIWQHQ